MAYIYLNGKHATPPYDKTLVDDNMFDLLNKYRWKAKPNGSGSGIYAVRNTKQNGKHKTIRMHRVVLGVDWDGVLDIDHINRDPLDNTRCNLRLVTRSQNIRNTQGMSLYSLLCKYCDSKYELMTSASVASNRNWCGQCEKPKSKAKIDVVWQIEKKCFFCGDLYKAVGAWRHRQVYCSDKCRYDAKNKLVAKNQTTGTSKNKKVLPKRGV